VQSAFAPDGGRKNGLVAPPGRRPGWEPDEAADVTGQHFGRKSIQPLARVGIQLFRYPRFDPALGGDKGVRA
jgi:hypothetical protein